MLIPGLYHLYNAGLLREGFSALWRLAGESRPIGST
jgi:hypothetical protein